MMDRATNRQGTPSSTTRRRPKRKRRIHKGRLFALILFCASLFFAIVYFSMLILFNIETIHVVGGKRYSEEEVALVSGVVKGESILKVDKSSVKQRLEKELPYIETAKIRLKLPSTVEITVTEAQPAMAVEHEGEYYLLSMQFKLLEKISDTENISVPMVVGIDIAPCDPGDFVEFEDNSSKELLLDIFAAMVENDMLKDIQQLDITDHFGITARLSEALSVYFGTSADMSFKLRFCQSIAMKLTEGEKGVIDVSDIKKASFRFQN